MKTTKFTSGLDGLLAGTSWTGLFLPANLRWSRGVETQLSSVSESESVAGR